MHKIIAILIILAVPCTILAVNLLPAEEPQPVNFDLMDLLAAQAADTGESQIWRDYACTTAWKPKGEQLDEYIHCLDEYNNSWRYDK